MKNINDSKLYFYFIIITLGLGIILGAIYSYSALIVQPKVENLIHATENIDQNYKTAYALLKNPQIFARYENFDKNSQHLKKILEIYEKKTADVEQFTENDRLYLQVLLDRRQSGAELTFKTMIFLFLLTLLGLSFYLFELKQNRAALKNVL